MGLKALRLLVTCCSEGMLKVRREWEEMATTLHTKSAPEHTDRTRPRSPWPWIAALVVVAVVAAGAGFLAAGLEDTATVLGEGRVPVIGTEQLPRDCTWDSQRTTDSVITGTLICGPIEMSDSRVSGTEEWEMIDPYYIWYRPETGRFNASVVLTNEEGVWRGLG